ncbi:hypothetical protein GGX14DRAFT_648237 [Mycena pura]|uniref:Uncharacterized protein n=1 Tax=Mycena pura TaxID=153505 RepID=A0AAD6YMK3_9AGAR|nr:hypothetical protein GGX14DRAFT_648237 [Mycena pura]
MNRPKSAASCRKVHATKSIAFTVLCDFGVLNHTILDLSVLMKYEKGSKEGRAVPLPRCSAPAVYGSQPIPSGHIRLSLLPSHGDNLWQHVSRFSCLCYAALSHKQVILPSASVGYDPIQQVSGGRRIVSTSSSIKHSVFDRIHKSVGRQAYSKEYLVSVPPCLFSAVFLLSSVLLLSATFELPFGPAIRDRPHSRCGPIWIVCVASHPLYTAMAATYLVAVDPWTFAVAVGLTPVFWDLVLGFCGGSGAYSESIGLLKLGPGLRRAGGEKTRGTRNCRALDNLQNRATKGVLNGLAAVTDGAAVAPEDGGMARQEAAQDTFLSEKELLVTFQNY